MRKGTAAAIALACVVAALAMLILAVRQAPSHDEFYTLGHIRHVGFRAMWQSYRRTSDATPPFEYMFSWAIGRLIGTNLVAVRLPSIIAWVAATGSIGVYLRRLQPLAVFVGALVPTASALTGLGMTARPYALMLGCLGVALVAWQRTVDRPVGWAAPVVLALSLGLAGAFHYAAGAAIVALAVAEMFVRRRSPHRPLRVLVMIGLGLLPIVASVPLMSREITIQSAQTTSLTLTSLPAFYVSTARPAALLVLATLGAIAWIFWRRRGRADLAPLDRAQTTEETALGVALVCVVPPLVILGMWATSGFYLHRYSCPALFGGAILLGGATDLVARNARSLAAVIAVAAVLSVPIAVGRATLETPTRATIHSQLETLRLPPGGTRVVFLYGYEYLLARADRSGQAPEGWLLAAPSPEPGTQPAQVDLAHVIDSSTHPVDVVGDLATLHDFMGDQTWAVQVVARSHLDYDEVHRMMFHMLVRDTAAAR